MNAGVEPNRNDSYLVFAQQDRPRVELGAWDRHAERFFSTRIALAGDERPGVDRAACGAALRILVSPSRGLSPGARSVFARLRADEDLSLALRAEGAGNGGGLSLLARRCPVIWAITRVAARDDLALLLAAIFASVLLGPILDVSAVEIFGVKTAREKLASSFAS